MIKSLLSKPLRLLSLAALAAGGVGAQPQASPSAAGFTPVDPFEQIKIMGRGVNVLGYDPLWNDFQRARFHERHFQRIHEGGFQTVRVNLQTFRHMNDANQLDATWFKTLDWIVTNSLANHLQVILDEHDYGTCGTNPAGCKPKLMAFWEQVAQHYKDAPNSVLFEILNEPNGQLTAEVWNGWLKEALAIIRRTNPRRNVVIGPASWNNIHSLDQLRLPADDRNIIATVHYYLPMEFTHQGANWNRATANLSGVKWGTDAEKHTVSEDFAGVQQWSDREKRPILLGEFGAYDKGDIDSRVKYTSFVARTAERFGWAWTYWQFDSDFIVWDMAKDDWVQPIWKALVPGS
jgi:endoglucanase